jgi:tripartite-type tricarboxylate transporter receptor subunit TctC
MQFQRRRIIMDYRQWILCRKRVAAGALAVALATVMAQGALAQNFPDRPLRLIAPYGAGGSYDGIARLLALKLGEQVGQQVVVDNRPGASGRIGMGIAIKTPADGYNILILGNSQTIVPSVYKSAPYDLGKDIQPITMVAFITNVLLVHPSVPAKTAQEFVALAKAKPNTMRFSSGGTGGITHLAGELFAAMAGVQMSHVPYKSGALAMNAVLGNEVQMNVLNMLNAAPHVRSGKLRGLGVTGLKRSAFLPDLPTLNEAGLKGYEVVEFYAMAAPAGIAKPLLARLHSEMVKAVASADLQEKFRVQSAEPVTMSPEETRAFILAEQDKYGKIVRAVGITAE